MRCVLGARVVGLGLLFGALAGCGSVTSTSVSDAGIEPAAKASADEWKAIKAQVHEVRSNYKPWDTKQLGVVLQQVHSKMCIGGLPTNGNLQLLTNALRSKAFALGATGITQLEVHIVPWTAAPPAGHRCSNGYMEATATALILDKKQFPYLYPESRHSPVEKQPD